MEMSLEFQLKAILDRFDADSAAHGILLTVLNNDCDSSSLKGVQRVVWDKVILPELLRYQEASEIRSRLNIIYES